jgi:hypothetical protein
MFQLQRLYNSKWDGKMITDSELVRIWKDLIVAFFEVPSSQHLPGETAEDHEKPHDSQ